MILEKKYIFMILSELAYNSHSSPDYISINTKLIFEMKLREINGKIMDVRLANRENSSQRHIPDLYD